MSGLLDPSRLHVPHRPVLTRYHVPLNLGRRVRVTAVNANERAIVLATNTQSVYFFQPPVIPSIERAVEALRSDDVVPTLPSPSLVRMISLDAIIGSSGTIVKLIVNPQRPDLIALITHTNSQSTLQSNLYVVVCDPHSPKDRPSLLYSFKPETNGVLISQLVWRECADDKQRVLLFSGDSTGALIRHSFTWNRNDLIRRSSADLMHKFDTSIYTLNELSETSVLVNTYARSFSVSLNLFLNQPVTQTVIPIGSKERKEPFGGSIDVSSESATGVLLARPGRRIWKADSGTGLVQATLIVAPPPVSTFHHVALSSNISLRQSVKQDQSNHPAAPSPIPANLQFAQLLPMLNGIVAFTPSLNYISFIDIGHACISDWFDCFRRLIDVQCVRDLCYILESQPDDEAGTTSTNQPITQLSLIKATSPNTFVDELLKANSCPIVSLIQTVVKHRVTDRRLLTEIRSRMETEPVSGELLTSFETLVVDAERIERVEKDKNRPYVDWWDAPAQLAQTSTSASPGLIQSNPPSRGTNSPILSSPLTTSSPLTLSALISKLTSSDDDAFSTTAPSVPIISPSPCPSPEPFEHRDNLDDSLTGSSLLSADNLPFEEPELPPELEVGMAHTQDDHKKTKKKLAVLGNDRPVPKPVKKRTRKPKKQVAVESKHDETEQLQALNEAVPVVTEGSVDTATTDIVLEESTQQVSSLVDASVNASSETSADLTELVSSNEDQILVENADSTIVEVEVVPEPEPEPPTSALIALSMLADASLVSSLSGSQLESFIPFLQQLPAAHYAIMNNALEHTNLNSAMLDENKNVVVQQRFEAIRQPILKGEETSKSLVDQLTEWLSIFHNAILTWSNVSSVSAEQISQLSQLLDIHASQAARQVKDLLMLRAHCDLIAAVHSHDRQASTFLEFLRLHASFLHPASILSMSLHYELPAVCELYTCFGPCSELALVASLPSVLSDAPSDQFMEEIAAVQPPIPTFLIRQLLDTSTDAGKRTLLAFLNARCVMHCADANITQQFLSLALTVDAPSASLLFEDIAGGCQPVRHAHQARWSYHDTLMTIARSPRAYHTNSNTLIKLFAQHGFYDGMLIVYLRAFDRHPSISLFSTVFVQLLNLDDVNGLQLWLDSCIQRPLFDMMTRRNYAVQALEQFQQFQSINQSIASPRSIRFVHVLHSLAKGVGVPLLLHSLNESSSLRDLCTQSLPAAFYDSFLLMSALQHSMRVSSMKAMECIDSHLWSERSARISATTKQVLHGEMRHEIAQPIPPSSHRPFIEDASARPHWGQPLLNDRCFTCALSLQSGPAQMFSCGHSFHVQCSLQMACTKCFQ